VTGEEMTNARKDFGMSRKEFAVLLGYTGHSNNMWTTIKRYEIGDRDIPPTISRLIQLMHWYYISTGGLFIFEE